ncbi:hypothetical protein [Streptomyces capillispiralis]|uniref:C2H2-type domain-containing protein n=1 Tax=Streptomyces capillispiralis TaxID=68182 RepID=A0A561TIL2_9ACTN|nr:hypothetical protein [Streptomyces capillispiralis]TWF86973.1 hypothetical protein FHX78_113966 [Streptomyces capillispiralis]GHH90612.1 hypothetical protein GCM10017779_10690 [Streptomyces capillispiralis]
MTEIPGHKGTKGHAGHAGLRAGASAVVDEAYSFACMRCGHGWEQAYEIEHHTDAGGHEFVMYVADGRVVPSPLSRPTCQNCDGHVVRIMRPGRVASAASAASAAPGGPGEHRKPAGERHHWRLSGLLSPFRRAH